MKPDNNFFATCSCSNANENDYETLLKMMLKFKVPTVTIHKGNKKFIISFGAHDTTQYVFENNELFDIVPSKTSFLDWIATSFLINKGDNSIVTIYNR